MSELVVRSPYTGQELGRVPFATSKGIAAALAKSTQAFAEWKRSKSWERAQVLNIVADQLEARRGEFVELLRDEAGKPVQYSEIEVTRCLGVLRWAAGEAQRFSGELLRLDTTSSGREGFGIHTRFPRGPILGITPFNFPLNLVAHKVAPAIACGSSILIKPSPRTPLTAQKFISLFENVAPAGLVQLIMADDQQTEALTRAPEIKMISFTGSAEVGWLIRRQAPEKPTTLELGGNAWAIVLEDTPKEALPAIVKRVTGAAFGYAGQSCISVQNVAVCGSRFREFADLLAEATEKTTFGDPALREVVSGPLIRSEAARRIEKVLQSVPTGFRSFTSRNEKGHTPTRDTLLAPSLLVAQEVHEPLPSVIQEEIFGPVMTLTKFAEVEELIRRINSGKYGLQVGVFTQHLPTIERLYRELDVGGLVVNDVPTTRYDHQPYGGVKESGLGREGIRYAMEEMTEAKFLALSSVLPL